MPEVNSESLVNRLMRENELLTKHCDSWSRDYKSLAAKLDKAERDCELLRSALGGLVGASSREDLEQMELFIRSTPAPAEDRAASIDAIHALMKTLP